MTSPSPKPWLIVQMGNPPDDLRAHIGEQADWFRAALGEHGLAAQVVQPFVGEALPAPDTIGGAVISGSWAMVTDREAWSERTAEWVRDVIGAGTPLFGVCYGHQLMSHALGGEVAYHPKGREIGVLPIRLTPDAAQDTVMGDFPGAFHVHLTHEQSVVRVPPGATVLAGSDHDPHQILRYGPRAMSVQFHPEFTPAIMAHCVTRRTEALSGEGFDVPALLAGVQATPHALRLLRQFVAQTAAG
jgi:GMP synthase (glutamine-hydrolysing)